MHRFVNAAVAALLATGALALTGPPAAAATATCTGTVQIASLTFNPPQVSPGHGSTATVVAQNCTDQPQTASVLFVARFLGATTGIPAGCPAIDPLPPQSVTIPAGGTYTTGIGYTVLAGCTATSLQVTARLTGPNGAVLATQTASLPIVPAQSCTVAYRRTSEWAGGFVAQVGITNTGATAVTGWTLAFTFPGDQRVTSAWNAVVGQAGAFQAVVTARNVAYNATIAPGGTVTFGVVGTWHASDAAPTAFTLNGAPCGVPAPQPAG